MSYTGPERRITHVFVTHNTEYHTRNGVCVGVRDRRNGEWDYGHVAVGQTLMGGLGPGLATQIGPLPQRGARLLFSGELLTTPVVDVRRPVQELAEQYPLAS